MKANAKAEGNKEARKTVKHAVETYHTQRDTRGKKSKRHTV
jgi:hypothetical protein